MSYKVLFVSVNDRMRTFIPLGISYLSSALKRQGHSTCLFDTSFYAEQERLLDEKKKEDAGIFKPIDYSSIDVYMKESDLLFDLLSFISDELPDLIAFSIFSQSKDLNFRLAEGAKTKFDIPIVAGGVHVNIDPISVLSRSYIDYICMGEGEEAIVDLVEALNYKESVEAIYNIGYKKNGKVVMNKCRKPQQLDSLPFPDIDIFPLYHLYGPYRGELFKMGLVEFSRTCPYKCTYCGNDIMRKRYRTDGYNLKYRHKSPRRMIQELKILKDHYGVEFIRFVDGTFLAQKESVLIELAELYKIHVDLPFFCDATVHCITERKAELLKEMGCLCVNMGIECGNEAYRRKYLDRTMTNKKIINAFSTIKSVGIETRSFNIIGLPFETKENIMETIELNRQCKVDSASLSIFIPYEGTVLRDICIEHNLLHSKDEIKGDGTDPIIYNPFLSDDELLELYNNFSNLVLRR